MLLLIKKMDRSAFVSISEDLIKFQSQTNAHLALLGKARYFTSLEFKSSYWQVAMDEMNREKNRCRL